MSSNKGNNNKKDETDQLAKELESKLQFGDVDDVSKKDEDEIAVEGPPPVIKRIAKAIENAENVLVLTGAGVSVAAGIPDFRTPGTGLYDNLQKYNLPYAEAVFDINYYRHTPEPFVQLAAELWPSAKPDTPKPTLTHHFVSLLHEKNKLLRNYSQNIDGLEFLANIPEERLVECHGHFRTASCTQCRSTAPTESVQHSIVHKQQVPKCRHCDANVKPDIVFFGEQLPDLFHQRLRPDLKKADVCLVLGTSLQVPPVAFIPEMVNCPRILLNRERVGQFDQTEDLFFAGDCDDAIVQIAAVLGWEDELQVRYVSTKKGIAEDDQDEQNTSEKNCKAKEVKGGDGDETVKDDDDQKESN